MSEARAIAVLTHSAREDDPLARELRGAGTHVLDLPCVRTEHLEDASTLARALAALDDDDWLVVTSPAGADAVARVGRPRGRVAAIGPATAACLRGHGRVVDFVPREATGAAIAQELPSGGTVLLARSDRALADAPRILRERGFEVREVVAYRTVVGANGDVASVRDVLSSVPERVTIFISSPSALEGLLAAVDVALVAHATLAVSGTTTLAAVRKRLGPSVSILRRDEEVVHVAHR